MRIFITGGTGFIGRHVVPMLVSAGHKVLLLDDDLAYPERWTKSLKRFKPQAAIHLAWEGIPDYCAEVSAKNLIYGLKLFSILASLNCKLIISSGSCWEYGATSGKISEDFESKIQNPFSLAKLSLYKMGRRLADEKKIKFVWLRFFYVYGPGQKGHSLIPHVISTFKSGKTLELKNPSGGNDFVYVGDVANAVLLSVKKWRSIESGVYNVGSGKLTGVAEIVSRVAKHYGRSTGYIKTAKPKGFYADISKTRRALGWKPQAGIKEGIKETLKYFDGN